MYALRMPLVLSFRMLSLYNEVLREARYYRSSVEFCGAPLA